MRKIILLLLIIIFTCGFSLLPSKSLMNHSKYKKVTPENIQSVKIIRYTEGGAEESEVKTGDEISRVYNKLKHIKLNGKTRMSCTDNTTIYTFILNDGSKVTLEFECEWVIIDGKSYNIVK